MAESVGIKQSKPGESPSTGKIKQAAAAESPGASPGSGRKKNGGESPGSGRKKNGGESPGSGRMKPHQSPSTRAAKYLAGAAGHSFRKVTLTKPTFCHHCSDFIWGLVGYVCEVCNFMSHEKCLKHVRTLCSCMAPTLVRVPVAHCFGPAGQKKRFCCVCRKNLEGTSALRCEVCELHVHSDCAPFICSDCRLCHQDGGQDYDMFHHHWREGNTASGARCEVCRRVCGSSDVLAGMRCEWCGVTTHPACCIMIPPECGLGRLRNMILHPSCVRICSRNFSKMHCFRISEPPQQCELGKQTLRVFDGDDGAKRNQFRLVSIPRITKNEEVLEAALRAFYIPDDAQEYELQNYTHPDLLNDDIINRNGMPDNKAMFKDCPPEVWLLRAKPKDTELLKIYAGWLKVGVAYISITIGKSTTVDSVIKEALVQLGKQNENPADFNLMEVFMSSKQVQKQVLGGQELLLDKLQEIRKTSLRQMNQTRFYIVESRNRVVQVDLLIGGLPLQLNTEEYTELLQEHLAIKSQLVTITHIYPAQGALALQITCFSEAERVYMLAKDTSINGKQLSCLVIPEIMKSKLARGSCPLLVFVNPKSGCLKGREILYGFRKLLNPHQVFELTSGGPLPGLHAFREVPHFRMLVCGGDGTVGWVLGVLETIRHKLACPEPAISIIPLGTGNDLARVLRWGAGYSSEDPYNILVSVDEAEEVEMDRWTILFDAQEMAEDGKENGFLEPPKIVQMNNYFGLGIDAELSLDFHHAREEEPGKFNSRFHNKGVYVKVGLQKLSHTRNLHRHLKLQVDKQDIELPSIEGLIFLNIPSWGSGADLWGSDSDARFDKPRIDDGMLEIVGVTGVVHMGQVQSGLRSGIRLAQGSYIRITVTKPIPVQVDGEPWIQSPGQIIVSAAGPKVRMLRKSKAKQKKQSGSLKEGRAESPAPGEGAN
ncbi:diacylglycerol kinase theta isoform X2 [Ictalurus punctatus]|uniref:Diacylglycerol kinase n=1 Tax=Ictalurus punctatus TaxID=7998 RepID=A0A2D0SRI0_ICTPU|nr:diacylglycerol kinase theta isoform X2 [Ictalurus punctatus]